MPTENWNRLVVVQFNEREFRSRPDPGFRIDCKVSLKGKKQPEADISLYNVSKDTAQSILKAKRADLRVRVLAGYTDNPEDTPPVLFDGNIIRNGATYSRSGTDGVLKVQAKEGAIAFSKKVNIQVGGLGQAGNKLGDVLEQLLIQTLGTDGAQTAQTILRAGAQATPVQGVALGTQLTFETLNQAIPPGLRFKGPAWEVAQKIGDSFDLDIEFRQGFIEFYDRRKPRLREGPEISYELGNLLQRPNPLNRTKVKIKALLEPDLIPGDRFRLDPGEDGEAGVFVVLEHQMNISSGYGKPFYSIITARADP